MKKASSSTRSRKPTAADAARKPQSSPWRAFLQREVWGLALVALGLVTTIALVARTQGRLSEGWSLLLRRVFGVGAYPVALLLIAGGVLLAL